MADEVQIKVRIIANPEIREPLEIPEWVSAKLIGLKLLAQDGADSTGGYNISANSVLQAIKNKKPETVYAGAIEWWEKNIPPSDQSSINIPRTACIKVR